MEKAIINITIVDDHTLFKLGLIKLQSKAAHLAHAILSIQEHFFFINELVTGKLLRNIQGVE
ncbi:hypothetical protein ACXZ1K_05405 [Pedobacter sp. PWIIR3]